MSVPTPDLAPLPLETEMTEAEVLARLEPLADDRAVAHWRSRNPDSPLRPVGVGLTKLRKVARELGRDPELAATLWASEVYELRVIGLLIDDPRQLTRAQAERQVEQLQEGQLAHVFASCDATLAKAAIAAEVAEAWTASDDPVRRGCGFSLVYELSKSKKKSAPDESWFQERLARIDATWPNEGIDVRMAMASALMGMGKRSAALWPQALEIARAMGPIDFDPTGSCDPMDVTKHLDNDRVRTKLGV